VRRPQDPPQRANRDTPLRTTAPPVTRRFKARASRCRVGRPASVTHVRSGWKMSTSDIGPAGHRSAFRRAQPFDLVGRLTTGGDPRSGGSANGGGGESSSPLVPTSSEGASRPASGRAIWRRPEAHGASRQRPAGGRRKKALVVRKPTRQAQRDGQAIPTSSIRRASPKASGSRARAFCLTPSTSSSLRQHLRSLRGGPHHRPPCPGRGNARLRRARGERTRHRLRPRAARRARLRRTRGLRTRPPGAARWPGLVGRRPGGSARPRRGRLTQPSARVQGRR
jgi:hypothetical protein